MTFHAEIQVGYYDADDTFYGPFEHVTRIDAFWWPTPWPRRRTSFTPRCMSFKNRNLMARSCG